MMKRVGSLEGWLIAGLGGLVALGCSDVKSASGPGCTADSQCKGDRICIDGECVSDGSDDDEDDDEADDDSEGGGANSFASRTPADDDGPMSTEDDDADPTDDDEPADDDDADDDVTFGGDEPAVEPEPTETAEPEPVPEPDPEPSSEPEQPAVPDIELAPVPDDARTLSVGLDEFANQCWDPGAAYSGSTGLVAASLQVFSRDETDVSFDFCVHRLILETSSGPVELKWADDAWMPREQNSEVEVQGPWYSYADEEGSTITGDDGGFEGLVAAGEPICVSGSAAGVIEGQHDLYWGTHLQFNLNQEAAEEPVPYIPADHDVTGLSLVVTGDLPPDENLRFWLDTDVTDTGEAANASAYCKTLAEPQVVEPPPEPEPVPEPEQQPEPQPIDPCACYAEGVMNASPGTLTNGCADWATSLDSCALLGTTTVPSFSATCEESFGTINPGTLACFFECQQGIANSCTDLATDLEASGCAIFADDCAAASALQ